MTPPYEGVGKQIVFGMDPVYAVIQWTAYIGPANFVNTFLS